LLKRERQLVKLYERCMTEERVHSTNNVTFSDSGSNQTNLVEDILRVEEGRAAPGVPVNQSGHGEGLHQALSLIAQPNLNSGGNVSTGILRLHNLLHHRASTRVEGVIKRKRSSSTTSTVRSQKSRRTRQHCKSLLMCEERLNKRHRKCSKLDPHHIADWDLRRLFRSREAEEAKYSEREKCIEWVVDKRSQEEVFGFSKLILKVPAPSVQLESLQQTVRRQNRQCVESRKCPPRKSSKARRREVDKAIRAQKCASLIHTIKQSNSHEREHLGEECDTFELHRLERRCSELRECCSKMDRSATSSRRIFRYVLYV